jgi:cytosine/adenosine deaminase-related metal-dependent hydrolase
MTLYLARYLLPISAPPIEDGALLLDQGRIAAVGRRAELLPDFTGEVVDFGDAVLLPPLVNAHTHLELSHFPRWVATADKSCAPASFVDWLLDLIDIKRSLSEDDLANSLQDGLRRCLRCGTGAVGDILSHPSLSRYYAASPLYGRLYFELLGVEQAAWQGALSRLEAQMMQADFGRLQPGLAPHAPYSLSPEAMETIFAIARGKNWPLTTHVAESPQETELLEQGTGELLERLYPAVGWTEYRPAAYNGSPMSYLDQQGGLQPGNLLVHGVQVAEADCRLLAERGVTMCLCPRSNECLGLGLAPVADYRTAGVKLALGTDSLASNDSLSMWDELAAARGCYSTHLSPAELLVMATRNGAEALGLKGEMGSLQVGSGGHFQVLPLQDPPPLAELEEFLCSCGCDTLPSAVYLAGRERLQFIDREKPGESDADERR